MEKDKKIKKIAWNNEAEGPFSEEALCEKIAHQGYQVSRYMYPPGTFFSDHTHSSDKIDGVVSGEFFITLAGSAVTLQPGDILHVPKGTVHSAKVIGDAPVVSLDGIKY